MQDLARARLVALAEREHQNLGIARFLYARRSLTVSVIAIL